MNGLILTKNSNVLLETEIIRVMQKDTSKGRSRKGCRKWWNRKHLALKLVWHYCCIASKWKLCFVADKVFSLSVVYVLFI